MYQINDDDLAALEHILPTLLRKMYAQCNDPITRKEWEEVRRIVSDARWGYGPPSKVKVSPDDDQDTQPA